VPLEFRFYYGYKLRYMHFRFNDGHLGFPTSAYVGQKRTAVDIVEEDRCNSQQVVQQYRMKITLSRNMSLAVDLDNHATNARKDIVIAALIFHDKCTR